MVNYEAFAIVSFLISGAALLISYLRSPKRSNHKPPVAKETSKKLAYWASILATCSFVVPYIFSAFDKNVISDLAGTVFTCCTGYLITYASKSAFEKHSRNMHKLDPNGVPYSDTTSEGGSYAEDQLDSETLE
jgi:hypothetical protein